MADAPRPPSACSPPKAPPAHEASPSSTDCPSSDHDRLSDLLASLVNDRGGLDNPLMIPGFVSALRLLNTHPLRMLSCAILSLSEPSLLAAVMAAGGADILTAWLGECAVSFSTAGEAASALTQEVLDVLKLLPPATGRLESVQGLAKAILQLRAHDDAAVAAAADSVAAAWCSAAVPPTHTSSAVTLAVSSSASGISESSAVSASSNVLKTLSCALNAQGRATVKRSRPDDGVQQVFPLQQAGSGARLSQRLRTMAGMGSLRAPTSSAAAAVPLPPRTGAAPLAARASAVAKAGAQHRGTEQQEPHAAAAGTGTHNCTGAGVVIAVSATAAAAHPTTNCSNLPAAAPRPVIFFPNLSVGLAGSKAQAAPNTTRFASPWRSALAASAGAACAAAAAASAASTPGSSASGAGGSTAAKGRKAGRRVEFKSDSELEAVRWFRKDEDPRLATRDAAFTAEEFHGIMARRYNRRAALPAAAAPPQQQQQALPFGDAARQEHLSERRLLRAGHKTGMAQAMQAEAEGAKLAALDEALSEQLQQVTTAQPQAALAAPASGLAWSAPPPAYINPCWKLAAGEASTEVAALAAAAASAAVRASAGDGGVGAVCAAVASPMEPAPAAEPYSQAAAGTTPGIAAGAALQPAAVPIIPFNTNPAAVVSLQAPPAAAGVDTGAFVPIPMTEAVQPEALMSLVAMPQDEVCSEQQQQPASSSQQQQPSLPKPGMVAQVGETSHPPPAPGHSQGQDGVAALQGNLPGTASGGAPVTSAPASYASVPPAHAAELPLTAASAALADPAAAAAQPLQPQRTQLLSQGPSAAPLEQAPQPHLPDGQTGATQLPTAQPAQPLPASQPLHQPACLHKPQQQSEQLHGRFVQPLQHHQFLQQHALSRQTAATDQSGIVQVQQPFHRLLWGPQQAWQLPTTQPLQGQLQLPSRRAAPAVPFIF